MSSCGWRCSAVVSQCAAIAGRNQRRQTSEDSSGVDTASAATAAAADADADDDDDDGDDPFDIPEESDDLTGLAVGRSPDRTAAGVEKQTTEMELEPMSSPEWKEKLGRGRRDGSVDGQSPSRSRTDSGRRKVSI